ncbi:hypothetical protein AB205_0132960 [Aquarana catesbeiana]|uniref:Uncharacterized protein n=1 Tax=Aquarana catesbeiana TaxID=8400 RepID=A0A2G9Q6B1_AQUCT|nr:hypothetical protein AB205_0132960 [Aquarana catesbeiana]
MGKLVTTTDDVDVVEEESYFTSASAHVLIGGGSWCAIMIYKRSRKTSMMWKKDSKTSLMF